jgi:hypothetical protein
MSANPNFKVVAILREINVDHVLGERIGEDFSLDKIMIILHVCMGLL